MKPSDPLLLADGTKSLILFIEFIDFYEKDI